MTDECPPIRFCPAKRIGWVNARMSRYESERGKRGRGKKTEGPEERRTLPDDIVRGAGRTARLPFARKETP